LRLVSTASARMDRAELPVRRNSTLCARWVIELSP
jgi:hypothetical protein